MPLRLGQMLKLYVPLGLIAGLVVALPTLAAGSGVGRSFGVVGGVGVLALCAVWVAHRARRPHSFSSIGDQRTVTVPLGGSTSSWVGTGDVDAARMMRKFTRMRWLARLWPVMTIVGLVAGGLFGAWADSFVLTVLLAATGFLLASLASMGLALSGVRRITKAMPPEV
jgi:hypothetical protein